jgi:hypothetical protein
MRDAFTLTVAVALLAGQAHADTRDIGMTSATKNEVIVVSGADRRGLKIGDRVFQEQQIRTGADSAAQLLFLDETALTVGPNSALVLDKAVFDPDKKTGELSVRAVSGAFRFISGSSPSANYTIKTPAGTIGVRGTWFEFRILGDIVHILVRRGGVLFCNDAQQCIRVPAGHQIRANRTQISAVTRASHETLESVVQLWFSGNPTDPAQLAPGAGPPNDFSGNDTNSAGNRFWWQTTRDFQPDRSQFNTSTPGPEVKTCDAACAQRRATAKFQRTVLGLARFGKAQDLSNDDRRFVVRVLLPDALKLKREIGNIDNREELRDFRRDLREFKKDAKKLIKCVDQRSNNFSCVVNN